MSDRLRSAVIVIVVLVWAANVVVPIFVKDYESIPELNAAFMGMVGLIIAGGRHNGERNEEEPTNELGARRAAREVEDEDPSEGRP